MRIAAAVTAIAVMVMPAGSIADVVHRPPTVKMLALSFLVLIGVLRVANGRGQHIPKGDVDFAMAFAFGVEMLNLRFRRQALVALRQRYVEEGHKPL